MSEMRRNVFICILPTNDGCGENGIGRCKASGHCQARQKVQARHKSINEASRDKPSLEAKGNEEHMLSDDGQELRESGRTQVMTGTKRKNMLFQWRAM